MYRVRLSCMILMLVCFNKQEAVDLDRLVWINSKMGWHPSKITEHCVLLSTHTDFVFCNYVVQRQALDLDEIQEIVDYFQNLPFLWFVPMEYDEDDVPQKLLQSIGLRSCACIHAMHLDLDEFEEIVPCSELMIRQVIERDELELWYQVACKARKYCIDEQSLRNHIAFLYQRLGDSMKLYLGYNKQGIPVCCSMLVLQDDMVTLHWVSTLPELCNQGFGYAISYYPLHQAKKFGYQQAYLLSTERTYDLYAKLGFRSCAQYLAYVR